VVWGEEGGEEAWGKVRLLIRDRRIIWGGSALKEFRGCPGAGKRNGKKTGTRRPDPFDKMGGPRRGRGGTYEKFPPDERDLKMRVNL